MNLISPDHTAPTAQILDYMHTNKTSATLKNPAAKDIVTAPSLAELAAHTAEID